MLSSSRVTWGQGLQPRAWFIIRPNGKRYGPSFSAWQAQVEAGRLAAKRPQLEAETAAVLYRSLARIGWRIADTGTKDIAATPMDEPPMTPDEPG